MNLLKFRESLRHDVSCAAHAEGQWCCLDYIPDDQAERIKVRFHAAPYPEKPRLELSLPRDGEQL